MADTTVQSPAGNRIRREAREKQQRAVELASDGDEEQLAEAERLVAEIKDDKARAERADTVYAAAKAAETMFGDDPLPKSPPEHKPSTLEEQSGFDPNEAAKERQRTASYKPFGWVKGLPAACQPDWIREHMGDAEREEAGSYVDVFEKWFRSRDNETFKLAVKGDELATKALQEGTDSEGGYLVPEDFRATVVKLGDAMLGGIYRPRCRVIQTGLQSGEIPTVSAVTFGATVEEGTIPDKDPTIGRVQFSVIKRTGLVRVSTELLEDSRSNIPSLLRDIFTDAKGKDEDEMIITGDGTTEFHGIKTNGTPPTTDASGTFARTHVTGFWEDLPAGYRRNAVWACSSSFIKAVLDLEVTDEKGSLLTAVVDNILQRPVVPFDTTVAANGWDRTVSPASGHNVFGAFCDMSQYYLVDRVGMSLQRNDALYMGTDQVGFFMRFRGDGVLADPLAFRLMRYDA